MSFTGNPSQLDLISSGEKELRKSVHELVTRTNDPFDDKVIGYVAPKGTKRRGYHFVI